MSEEQNQKNQQKQSRLRLLVRGCHITGATAVKVKPLLPCPGECVAPTAWAQRGPGATAAPPLPLQGAVR